MNIWMTSDPHFGKYSNRQDWLDIMNDYYYNFFIPNVEKHKTKDDILICLGDVFDDQEILNVQVINDVLKLFTDLNSLFKEVHILCGNHDIYRKDTVEINSLKILNQKDLNLNLIIRYPFSFQTKGKTLTCIPWQVSTAQEKETLKRIGKSDYTFAHTGIQGAHYRRGVKIEHGSTAEDFYGLGQVFTGHIHTTQTVKNVQFIGSPYELTRNDMGNEKAIYYFDVESGKVNKIVNNHSPKFLEINDDFVLNNSQETVNNVLSNNWITANVSNDIRTSPKTLKKLMDKIIIASPRNFIANYENVKMDVNKELVESMDLLDGENFTDLKQLSHFNHNVLIEKILQTKGHSDLLIQKVVHYIGSSKKELGDGNN